MLTYAGNTLIYEELKPKRRHVNATLKWPQPAESQRPPLDEVPMQVHPDSLLETVRAMQDEPVIWLGALVNVSRGVNGTLDEALQDFHAALQPCLDC